MQELNSTQRTRLHWTCFYFALGADPFILTYLVFLFIKEFPYRHIHIVPDKYYKENVSVDVLVDSHMKNVSAIVNFAFLSSFVGIIMSVITGFIFSYLGIKEPFYTE